MLTKPIFVAFKIKLRPPLCHHSVAMLSGLTKNTYLYLYNRAI